MGRLALLALALGFIAGFIALPAGAEGDFACPAGGASAAEGASGETPAIKRFTAKKIGVFSADGAYLGDMEAPEKLVGSKAARVNEDLGLVGICLDGKALWIDRQDVQLDLKSQRPKCTRIAKSRAADSQTAATLGYADCR